MVFQGSLEQGALWGVAGVGVFMNTGSLFSRSFWLHTCYLLAVY